MAESLPTRQPSSIDQFVRISGSIPRSHIKRADELFRLRHAHPHLPLPPHIDGEITPEQEQEEKAAIRALSPDVVRDQIIEERERIQKEIQDQWPKGLVMP